MRDHDVVISNQLVGATYRCSLVEQRVLQLAICEARRTEQGLGQGDCVVITAKDYVELYGVATRKAYQQLADVVPTLTKCALRVVDDADVVRVSRWLSRCEYTRGDLAVAFSPLVVQHITRLEREFTKYRLRHVAQMTSSYAIRLYQMLAQYANLGNREIALDWLRQVLRLDDEYLRFNNFRAWVLDPAVGQINLHSDLSVTYSQKKDGRTVERLCFEIERKPDLVKEARAERKAERKDAAVERLRAKRQEELAAQALAAEAQRDADRKRRESDDAKVDDWLSVWDAGVPPDDVMREVLGDDQFLWRQYRKSGVQSGFVRAALARGL